MWYSTDSYRSPIPDWLINIVKVFISIWTVFCFAGAFGEAEKIRARQAEARTRGGPSRNDVVIQHQTRSGLTWGAPH